MRKKNYKKTKIICHTFGKLEQSEKSSFAVKCSEALSIITNYYLVITGLIEHFSDSALTIQIYWWC